MSQPSLRRSPRRSLVLALTAALLGCQAPAALQGPDPTQAGAKLQAQARIIDVDPFHGAAFERPASAEEPGLRPLLTFPDVRHDLQTGRTTVTMQVANPSAAALSLSATLQGERPLADSAGGTVPLGVVPAGGTISKTLVFNNPNAGSFAVNLGLAGEVAAAPAAPLKLQQAGALIATADSGYGTMTPDQAVDNDINTFWANANYRQMDAWIQVDTGAVTSLSGIKVKMAPQTTGATYRIETSTDGVSFTPVTGALKNTSWNLEPKSFTSSARYVRLHFTNDPVAPESRFMVFEIQVPGAVGGGTASPAPSPSPSPSASPSATPTPSSAPSAPPGSGLVENFESYALGAQPPLWRDVRDDGFSYSWLVAASWFVADQYGSKRFVHDNLSNVANLSFRRYVGTAFGPNGALPARYTASTDVTPMRSYTYSPTGDQGTQQFYLNPTNYLEILLKPNYQEVWAANNAPPFQSAGWQRLYYRTVTNTANTTYNLKADVDTVSHQFKAYINGELLTTLTHPLLGSTQPHYFTLRGTGNVVAHDNVTIQAR